jgi:DNA-binding MarR family transcriptional regulator
MGAELRGKDESRMTEKEAKFFENNLAYAIMVVANLIGRITTHQVLASSKLSLSDWRVLRIARTFGPVSAADIIAAIGMDKTTVSRAITNLHELQFIKLLPNSADRRQTLVALTAAGTRELDRLLSIDEQCDRSFELLLSDTELRVFRKVMHKLRAHTQSLAAQASLPRHKTKKRAST